MAFEVFLSETGNKDVTLDKQYLRLIFANDSSTSSATLIINGIPLVIRKDETIEETFNPFNTYSVQATGPWRTFVCDEYVEETIEEVVEPFVNMKVDSFLASIRYDIRDMAKTKFSDYELIDIVRTVLRSINTTLVKLKSSLVIKEADLTSVNGVAHLPGDFIAVVSVTTPDGELSPYLDFKLMDNHILVNSNVTLRYYFMFPNINLGEGMPIPDWLTDYARRYVNTIIKNGQGVDGTLMQQIYNDLQSVTQTREYSFIDRAEMPFSL